MKKYLYLLAAIAFAAVSCNKELETPQEESLPAGQKTITLAVSSGETKSFVQDSDAGTISWAEGDEVGVFTDLDTSSPIRFTMSTYTGSSANCTLDNCLIRILLPFYSYRRIDGNGAKPIVALKLPCRRL